MHPSLQQDLSQFPQILDQVRQLAATFLAGLHERPVCPPLAAQQLKPGDDRLSDEGVGAQAALDYFWQRYADGISASAGPRYFGFVTGGVTPASLAADWLVSAIDQNSQLSHDTVAAAIELAAIEQLKSLLGLPADFSGTLVSGATMANFCGLAIGRQWLGNGAASMSPSKAWRRWARCRCWPPAPTPAAKKRSACWASAATRCSLLPPCRIRKPLTRMCWSAIWPRTRRRRPWCWPAPARSIPWRSTISRGCWRCASATVLAACRCGVRRHRRQFPGLRPAAGRLAAGGLHHRRCA
ncbi:Uncharacterised protein [Serratia rubidaea]|uniref:L-2,4-diaminobutyrate decarboxylase n=1 Tax=Serratia rubidaea TaxID=61652 RepID=A0A4U9HKL4_SERRU|nr:Uncharacterised protein [Serratia rubidaea]